LIKYLTFLAKGDEKEAMTLEKVLFTVLATTQQELQGLEKARKKRNAGMMSYFYASGKSSVATPLTVKKSKGGVMPNPMTP
jgi:hypothetical protein